MRKRRRYFLLNCSNLTHTHTSTQMAILWLVENLHSVCCHLLVISYFIFLYAQQTLYDKTQAEGKVTVKHRKLTCLSSSAAPSSQPHPLYLPPGDLWANNKQDYLQITSKKWYPLEVLKEIHETGCSLCTIHFSASFKHCMLCIGKNRTHLVSFWLVSLALLRS